MKIAFVLPGPGTSGGVRAIERVASGLLARGHRVRILCYKPPGTLRDVARDAYMRLRHGRPQDWLAGFRGPVETFTTLTPQAAGTNDVIIGVGVGSVLAIAPLPRECGIQVHNSHGAEPWIPEQMARAWQLPMPRIVVASYLERQMRSQGCLDPIYLAPNGIDPADYYPAAVPGQRQGVGTVFHTSSAKNPEAIRAILGALEQRRPEVPLYVFGAVRSSGLPATTRYVRLPPVETARQWYSRSLVWFCVSRWEGFGLPLLEAMACGCAVVSTDCGGPSDIIEEGVSGFLVPVDDTQQQVARILQLLDDNDLRGNMIDRSQATVARFSWPRALDAFENALRAIVTASEVRSVT